jgi:hypothetical protein
MLLVHEGYASTFLEYYRVYQSTIVFATLPFGIPETFSAFLGLAAT